MSGVAEGCRQAGCALLGGETAEMPGMYSSGEYDLAGFTVGAVERGRILPSKDIGAGDVVIGLASSGVHSNGYSLVRRLVQQQGLSFEDTCPFAPAPGAMIPQPNGTYKQASESSSSFWDDGVTLGQVLLSPTRIYCRPLLPLLRSGQVKAFAHITGGGLLENVPRVLPAGTAVTLDASCWEMPAVFGWLAALGKISTPEMARTFNCGLGGVLVVAKEQQDAVLESLRKSGERAWHVGEVIAAAEESTERVQISNLSNTLEAVAPKSLCSRPIASQKSTSSCRTAVLISGSGTNLQALIDDLLLPNRQHAEIVLVFSNKDNVQGLERARKAGIPTKVRDGFLMLISCLEVRVLYLLFLHIGIGHRFISTLL